MKNESNKGQRDEKQGSRMGAGIAIGVGIGVAIGAAMDNIGVGIAIGAGAGVAIGAALDAARKKRSGSGSEWRTPDAEVSPGPE